MVKEADRRGFEPACVVFDSWYFSLDNLKLLRSFDWIWLTRLKSNRQVNPEREGLRAVSEVERSGRVVWLEGYGLMRIFKTVATNGEIEWWATNRVEMLDVERVKWAGYAWAMENYHRALEAVLSDRAGARRVCAARGATTSSLCLRAFLRLESHCYHKGISWYEAKTSIIREAVRARRRPSTLLADTNCVTSNVIEVIFHSS